LRVRRQLLRFLLRRLTKHLIFPLILTGVQLLPGAIPSSHRRVTRFIKR
jgi:hypothetical protein